MGVVGQAMGEATTRSGSCRAPKWSLAKHGAGDGWMEKTKMDGEEQDGGMEKTRMDREDQDGGMDGEDQDGEMNAWRRPG